jgi:glycosyltransferase involved in cell wall biosynthesis
LAKRVLFLTYYFPPIGGAGVQRSAQLVRYLPELGYQAIVVTGPGELRDRWVPFDDTMAAGIAPGTAVHRLPAPEPAHSTGWRRRAERWLRVEPRWQAWWRSSAVQLGKQVGATADVIYATIAPYETADAASRLAHELGKPLVIDLEDPWALDEMLVFPSALHRRIELTRMRRTLMSADAVVMNTAESARRVTERWPEFRRKMVRAIPNGFDSADFRSPGPTRQDRKYRIVHTGSLHTELGLWQHQMSLARRVLGGAVAGVDLLTRSHVYLLKAVNQLIADRPELASIIEVHLAGVLTEADRRVVSGSSVVHVRGFLTHADTVELIRSADLLFLPMHDLPPGRRVSIVPCKTYEYLASGRPILGAVPEGDARDLLAESGSASLCRPADVEGMRLILQEQIRRFEAGEPSPAPRADVLNRFAPQRLTRDVGTLLDQVLASSCQTIKSRGITPLV